MGPTRVWLADKDTPGLSMTRAFGDTVASSVGVIAQPHVLEIALEPEHQYLVLCSDGIYEFMSNDEIVGIVHAEAEKGALPAQIAKLLVCTVSQIFHPGIHILQLENITFGDNSMLFCQWQGAPADKLHAKAANVLHLVGLARSKQDVFNRGHGAQYLCRPPPAGTKYIRVEIPQPQLLFLCICTAH